MYPPRRQVRDLTKSLKRVAGSTDLTASVDALLGEALEALATLIPYRLATIMELDGNQLRVRVARGEMADQGVESHRLDLTAFPSLRQVLDRGRAQAFQDHDHRDGDGDPFDGVLDLPHGHSCMVVPLKVEGTELGLMTLDDSKCVPYSDEVVHLAGVLGRLVALALRYGEQSGQLRVMVDQLEEQNRLLLEEVGPGKDPRVLLEESLSPRIQEVRRLARQVAPTRTPVLILGETGTGKEVLARAIHLDSDRAHRPLVSINCAALPESLIESELFGHVKGAFSGADRERLGRFRAANGGTLFLDEIGELPLDLQAKLLRVLQEGCFEPLGSDQTLRVDVRILAATHRDLRSRVEAGTFREDLYYRLAVFPLELPPLRDRPEDLPVLARTWCQELSPNPERPVQISDQALALAKTARFPGNLREFRNLLERASILARDGVIGPEHLQIGTSEGELSPSDAPLPAPRARALRPLRDVEKDYIEEVVRSCGGRIAGDQGAAQILGLPPSTLRSRMKKLGLLA